MIKKTLLVLFLLLSAIPAMAVPQQCSCLFCHGNTTSLCTSYPGTIVMTCGTYSKFCGVPGTPDPVPPGGGEQSQADLSFLVAEEVVTGCHI